MLSWKREWCALPILVWWPSCHRVSQTLFHCTSPPQVNSNEGKCWKRRIEIVIREYHKWRTYFKKRVQLFFLTTFSTDFWALYCDLWFNLHGTTRVRMSLLREGLQRVQLKKWVVSLICCGSRLCRTTVAEAQGRGLVQPAEGNIANTTLTKKKKKKSPNPRCLHQHKESAPVVGRQCASKVQCAKFGQVLFLTLV